MSKFREFKKVVYIKYDCRAGDKNMYSSWRANCGHDLHLIEKAAFTEAVELIDALEHRIDMERTILSNIDMNGSAHALQEALASIKEWRKGAQSE